jgi:hypothetical protein
MNIYDFSNYWNFQIYQFHIILAPMKTKMHPFLKMGAFVSKVKAFAK